ncbi:S-adenosylmethionine mitochondrial carrier protein isoform X3 [Sapajus apella]|uniref:Mitochondrial S-adenosylmethionine carrier protein n=1 Tax=Sapajus apella TaxID=9515 RepID=A0A6J3IWE3_SAPAP|nr:S-adenosylmethionine mitochondrial carrier protein isoform X3 [Sapajus apella]
MDRPGFMASLVAGGIAGVSVDLILFPLDTIKTRLQSPQGFHKAGGFHGIYAGVPSAAIGSFPNAAAFFITYEYVKWFLHTDSSSYLTPMKHMLAASAGEVVACLIRVPSEVVKQRAQVSASTRTFQIFSNILYEEGIQGLYRGYKSTVLRELGCLWNDSNGPMARACCWTSPPPAPTPRAVPGRYFSCWVESTDSFFFGPVSLMGVLKMIMKTLGNDMNCVGVCQHFKDHNKEDSRGHLTW